MQRQRINVCTHSVLTHAYIAHTCMASHPRMHALRTLAGTHSARIHAHKAHSRMHTQHTHAGTHSTRALAFLRTQTRQTRDPLLPCPHCGAGPQVSAGSQVKRRRDRFSFFHRRFVTLPLRFEPGLPRSRRCRHSGSNRDYHALGVVTTLVCDVTTPV